MITQPKDTNTARNRNERAAEGINKALTPRSRPMLGMMFKGDHPIQAHAAGLGFRVAAPFPTADVAGVHPTCTFSEMPQAGLFLYSCCTFSPLCRWVHARESTHIHRSSVMINSRHILWGACARGGKRPRLQLPASELSAEIRLMHTLPVHAQSLSHSSRRVRARWNVVVYVPGRVASGMWGIWNVGSAPC
jgi:hypothetical protein